ncbi:LysR substrate-binding domain-containing protein [Sinorhizobium meliloti]|uniref:LysR substrate-binding domain-containing protein n=1 Tax=Rhizobium meliloti TaxID=382 RepID=UPI001F1D809B|nr:LysR substrate-binding domain-containing protein [Sinorhizobium meliloti]
MLLEPLLLEYGRRYPEVELEVVSEKGLEAGVRLAEAISPDILAVPITRPRSLVVGSPEYFKGRSKPIVPLDLVQHRCIEMRMANGRMYRWEFERRGEAHVFKLPAI